MKTIIEAMPKQDPAKIHETLQKGYGTKHPEKIHGYAAFFMDYGEVKASDHVAYGMEHNRDFREFVYASIRSFKNDDYGLISDSDWDNNIEDKWISGGYDLMGRYAYGTAQGKRHGPLPERIIKIRYYRGTTYVLYDAEFDWIIKEK